MGPPPISMRTSVTLFIIDQCKSLEKCIPEPTFVSSSPNKLDKMLVNHFVVAVPWVYSHFQAIPRVPAELHYSPPSGLGLGLRLAWCQIYRVRVRAMVSEGGNSEGDPL